MTFAQPLPRARLVVRGIAGLSLLVALSCSAAANQNFSVKPPSPWVENLPAGAPTAAASSDNSGVVEILADFQYRITASGTERYYHRVKKLVSSSALEDSAEIKVDFEPSYQQLVIHHVSIIRNGTTINALKPNEIKVIQQENDLQQRIYNGTLTALIFPNDVRVGDIIDYAVSVNGDNPVLGGRFVGRFHFAESDPVQRLRWRVISASSRTLYLRNQNSEMQPQIKETGAEREYLWDLTNTPALEYEDSVPSWFQVYPAVQVSEFASWDDVLRFDVPLFEVKQTLPAELTKLIGQWVATLHSPEERVLAAVRFVQDEVRYLGIELGPYSHRPNEPATVFQRRFGDCKDKSLLLCAILRALGVEAYPAVVNTSAEHMLDNWQPSPFAFDHCIVQAKLDGKTYWIDPTETLTRGRLADRFNPPFERALVVRPGSHELEQIPLPPTDVVTSSIVETYRIDNYNSPVSLEAVTTYRGPYADAIRRSVASQSHSEFCKNCLNDYVTTFSSIEPEGDVMVSDNETENIVVVTERYRIPGFWDKGSRWLKASHVAGELSKPSVPRRKMPLALSYPLAISHTIEIHLPERRSISRTSKTITDGAIRLDYRLEPSDKVIKLDYKLSTLRDNVPPDRVARHLEVLEQINDSTWYELTQEYGSEEGTLLRVGVIGAFGVFIIAIGGGVLVVALVVSKRRRDVTRPRPPGPGEAPMSAIALAGQADWERHLAQLKCSCGTNYFTPGMVINRQGVTYAGRRVIVVDLKCPRCCRSRDVYFAPPAS